MTSVGALRIFTDDWDDGIERMLTVSACGIKQEGLQIQISTQSNPDKLKVAPKVNRSKTWKMQQTGKNKQLYKYKPSAGGDTGVMVGRSRA